MIENLHTLHEWRHTLRCSLAVAVSVTIGCIVDPANAVWMAMGTLLVVQTSRTMAEHQVNLAAGLVVLACTALARVHPGVAGRRASSGR